MKMRHKVNLAACEFNDTENVSFLNGQEKVECT